jgi:hypothetical protein
MVSSAPKQLRDEFAMAALTGFLTKPHFSPVDGREILYCTPEVVEAYCIKSYQYADWMLLVRDL